MESVAAQIYEVVKEQIIDGRIAPGERITEQSLAAQFNTSRTPVREALRQLAADGFAVFKRNSGTRVRQWTPAEMRELFDLRVLIESEIAGHAAAHIGASDLAELARLQDEIELGGADTRAANTARISPLNREFHRIIAEASQNSRLIAMLGGAVEFPIVQQTFRRYSHEQLARSFNHHRELIAALSAHDEAWARNAMACHIHSAKHTLLERTKHGTR